jgi:2-polyprenyl-6-methoxyphenol hydroxylase-like FAD-dependent oxidoreductase
MSRPVRRALIVGGGIGGMAATIAFRRSGIEVDLIDLDPDWRVYGAGITITGPTLRAFQRLGILEAVGEVGSFSDHVKFFDAAGNYLSSLDVPPLEDGIPGTGGILRPKLHKIMSDRTRASGADIRLGLTVADLAQDDDGVDVVFTDGSAGRYDLVVAADGSHSQMRERLFPAAPKLAFTGQGCWRMLAKRPEGVTSAEIYFGPDSLKVGFNPCSADSMYLFATVAMPGNPHVPDSQLMDGMRAILAPFGGRVAEIRDQLGEHSSINYRPLFAMLVAPPWNIGRVGMLGDAVHATTPHLASGAGISIEDGLVLAEEMVGAATIEAGWQAFTRRRWPRARLVVENSVEIGRLEQEGGNDAAIRDLMASSTRALAEAI